MEIQGLIAARMGSSEENTDMMLPTTVRRDNQVSVKRNYCKDKRECQGEGTRHTNSSEVIIAIRLNVKILVAVKWSGELLS